MRFLIDACLPYDLGNLLHTYGHVSIDVRDLNMASVPDPQVAAYAQANGLCLLSEDWGFSDIRAYPPAAYHGIVLFETGDLGIPEKSQIVRTLFDQPQTVARLPGRLAIVSEHRIRLRPSP